MNELDPLPDDLRELLDAERELDAPASATRERLLSRLSPLIGVPLGAPPAVDPGASGGGAASSAAESIARGGLSAKLLVPALCTLLGAAGGAATHAYLSRAAEPASPPAAHSVPRAPASAAPAASAPALASEPARALEPETARAPSAPNAAPRAEPAASGASLRAERLLLESATAALMRGNTASAMVSLKKHARLYPRGALAEEREVLWVRALRAQGQDKAAEERASQFERTFPKSLQQDAVRKPSGSP